MIAKRFGLWADPSQEVSLSLRLFSAGRAPGAVPTPLCLASAICSSCGLCSLHLPFSDSLYLWERHTVYQEAPFVCICAS